MARVFTVYNCGTGFNRERTEELIANLATITTGTGATPASINPGSDTWIINDGPGSKAKVAGSGAATPGSGLFKQLRGNISGHGWEQNVANSMNVIRFIHKSSPLATVNMAGWSRGAITCHMLAHALHKDPATANIAVNIFAVDPVAGPGNREDPEKVTLAPNVHDYMAILSEDESRKIMKPVDVRALCAKENVPGKRKWYSIPGEHNTGVMQGTPASKIIWFLAQKFLHKRGTEFKKRIELSPLQVCELYAGIRIYMQTFRGMHGTAGKQLGRRNRNVANDFRDTAYFVNAHHVSQFKKAFPVLYGRIFEFNRGNVSEFDVDKELKTVQAQAPWTYTSFKKVGLI
jgi:hypothetical protein